jgi:hypothetical protein
VNELPVKAGIDTFLVLMDRISDDKFIKES